MEPIIQNEQSAIGPIYVYIVIGPDYNYCILPLKQRLP